MLRASRWFLLLAMIGSCWAAGTEPIVLMEPYRDPIRGRTVYGFSLKALTAPEADINVHVSYGGTATAGVDYTVPPTVFTLPAGSTGMTATYIPITALNPAAAVDGKTLIVTLDPDPLVVPTYLVSNQNANTATLNLLPAISGDQVRPAGEPDVVLTSGDDWTYYLNVLRPAGYPAKRFGVTCSAAPGATAFFPVTATMQTANDDATDTPLLFRLTATTSGAAKQYRIRITCKLDLDGLGDTDAHGAVNTHDDNLVIIQDCVLIVLAAGGSG